MKKLAVLLFLIPGLGFGQPKVNQDSLLVYFTKIINDYRVSKGLGTLTVDPKMKVLTDYWSKRMGEMHLVGHGTGGDDFGVRINNCHCMPPSEIVLENCTELMTPDVPFETKVQSYPELIPYIEKSYGGKLTQYQYAYYAFLMWKHSAPHHKSMLNPDTKFFYLSSYRKDGRTYLCYIARS
jgi:uncharacterized protein YkwD